MEFELLGLTGVLLCSAHLCLGYFGGRWSRERNIEQPSRAKPPFYLADMLDLIEHSRRLQHVFEPHQRGLPADLMPSVLQVIQAAETLHARVSRGTLASPAPPPLHKLARRPIGTGNLEQRPSSLSKAELMNLAIDAEYGRSASEPKLGNGRRPYTTRQNIAFYSEGFPQAHEFEQVQCLDLSVDGVSFLLNRPPELDQLVITLGTSPDLMFMTAKVVNECPVYKDGREAYRIGCQFLKRIEQPQYHWNLELGILEPLLTTSQLDAQE